MESKPLTSAELAEIKTLAQAATPGPWSALVEMDGDEGYEITIPEINRSFFDPEWADPLEWEGSRANAAYIAAANPQAVLALIARVRELEGFAAQYMHCPRCGDNVACDEDGCCAGCGSDAHVECVGCALQNREREAERKGTAWLPLEVASAILSALDILSDDRAGFPDHARRLNPLHPLRIVLAAAIKEASE